MAFTSRKRGVYDRNYGTYDAKVWHFRVANAIVLTHKYVLFYPKTSLLFLKNTAFTLHIADGFITTNTYTVY